MAEKTSQTRLLATLEYPLKVEIRAAAFEPYSALSYLDVSKLSKGSHEIEVGFVKGGCCGLKAFAMVEAGMVVAVKVEPESKKPVSKNLRALVDAAFEKSGARPPKWVPVSVEDFFGTVSERLSVSIGGGCLEICWGDGTLESPKTCVDACSTDDGIVIDISQRAEIRL